jgi:RNA-directed DNA polymerase
LKDFIFQDITEGFLQGSLVSSPLANLILNGLEEYLGEEFLIIKYVADFIVAGKSSEEFRNVALPKINSFLLERGLKLDLDKTCMFSIKEGFDFLGLNFWEYPDKHRTKGIKKGIFLVKPSSTKVKIFNRELFIIIKKYKNRSVYDLVLKLNQKLRGWAESYKKVTSQKTFSIIQHHVWRALWVMICKKHRCRSKARLYKTYFEKVGKNKRIFVEKKGKNMEEKKLTLFQIPYIPIKLHVLCKDLTASDPASVEYFHRRNVSRSKNVFFSGKTKSVLAKLQKGYFPVCDLSLFNGEDLEIYHNVLRQENSDHFLKNPKLLHKFCHKQVEYSKDGNRRAVLLKKGILLPEKRMK